MRNRTRRALAEIHQAGDRLIREQGNISWRLKGDGTFLTRLDGEIQAALKASLGRIFPEYAFVGEEDEHAPQVVRVPKPRLVLDPIDGTAPYARGFNYYSISMAVVAEDGTPEAGIVYMPSRGRWYAAAREEGAWIRYKVDSADGGVNITPFGNENTSIPEWPLKDSYVYVSSDNHKSVDMTRFDGKIRALGATASHIALLLDSTPDPAAVLLTRYKVWDAVAGLALANAAGFEIRNLEHPEGRFELKELVNAPQVPPLVIGTPNTVGSLVNTVSLK